MKMESTFRLSEHLRLTFVAELTTSSTHLKIVFLTSRFSQGYKLRARKERAKARKELSYFALTNFILYSRTPIKKAEENKQKDILSINLLKQKRKQKKVARMVRQGKKHQQKNSRTSGRSQPDDFKPVNWFALNFDWIPEYFRQQANFF